MSLEDMYRKSVRQIRKRDAKNLLNKQQQEEAAPVKETDEHGGDLPYQEPNDNGWGTHTEYPNIPCPRCPAKFHFNAGLDIHTNTAHG